MKKSFHSLHEFLLRFDSSCIIRLFRFNFNNYFLLFVEQLWLLANSFQRRHQRKCSCFRIRSNFFILFRSASVSDWRTARRGRRSNLVSFLFLIRLRLLTGNHLAELLIDYFYLFTHFHLLPSRSYSDIYLLYISLALNQLAVFSDSSYCKSLL